MTAFAWNKYAKLSLEWNITCQWSYGPRFGMCPTPNTAGSWRTEGKSVFKFGSIHRRESFGNMLSDSFFKGKGYKRYTECSHWNGIEPTNKNPSLFRLKLKVATGVLTRRWGVGWAEIKPNWMYFGPRWFSSEKTFKVLSKNDRLKRKVNISHGITLFPYLWVTRVIVSTLENHCAISQI